MSIISRDSSIFSAKKCCCDAAKGRIKTELSWLKRKGAIKTDLARPDVIALPALPGANIVTQQRNCARCRTELGLIINRGAPCPSCRQRVCKNCREFGKDGKDWICLLCNKQIELQLATGEWMNQYAKTCPNTSDTGNAQITGDLLSPAAHKLPPAELIRRTLSRRSFCVPGTGEVPATFVRPSSLVTEKESPKDAKDTKSRDVTPKAEVKRVRKLSSDSTQSTRERQSPRTPLRRPVSYCAENRGSTTSLKSIGSPVTPTPPARRRQLPSVPAVVSPTAMKERPAMNFGDRPVKRPHHGPRGPLAEYSLSSPEQQRTHDFDPSYGAVRRSPRESPRRHPPGREGSPKLQSEIAMRPDAAHRRSHSSEYAAHPRPKSLFIPKEMSSDEYFAGNRSSGIVSPSSSHVNYRNRSPLRQTPPGPHQRHPPPPQGQRFGVDHHSLNGPQAARHSAPEHPMFTGPPMRPDRPSTLPRRPHSSHGELDDPNYGSLPRHHLLRHQRSGSSSEGLARLSSDSLRHASGVVSRQDSGNSSSELVDARHNTDYSSSLSESLSRKHSNADSSNSLHRNRRNSCSDNRNYSPERRAHQPDEQSPTVNQLLYRTAQPHVGPPHSPLDEPQKPPRGDSQRGSTNSIVSGFATTGRSHKTSPTKYVDSLRRSKSFHSEVTSAASEGAYRGSVAKKVKELERGIKDTEKNMKPKRIHSVLLQDGEDRDSTSPSGSKDLKYSHSFKYPDKNGLNLNYSRSFKQDTSFRNRSDDSDRYRPYNQPRRIQSWYEGSTGFSNENNNPKSILNRDFAQRDNINSESQQLLKKYSQESPTWCGVDQRATRRWKRNSDAPDDDFRDSDDNLTPRRHSTDLSDNRCRSPTRHYFYDSGSGKVSQKPWSPADYRMADCSNDPDEGKKSRKNIEGDDYKIVFVSSDSSRGSDVNTSLDSEKNAKSSMVKKAKSFREDIISNDLPKVRRKHSLSRDAGDSRSDRGNYRRDRSGDRLSSKVSLRSNSPLRPQSQPEQYDPSQPPPRPPKPTHLSGQRDFFSSIGAIHPSQLHAMLQQTEAVQAEAQALQAALMNTSYRPDNSDVKSYSVPINKSFDAKKNIGTAKIVNEGKKSRDITVNIQNLTNSMREKNEQNYSTLPSKLKSDINRKTEPSRSQSFKTISEKIIAPVKYIQEINGVNSLYVNTDKNKEHRIFFKKPELKRSSSDLSDFTRVSRIIKRENDSPLVAEKPKIKEKPIFFKRTDDVKPVQLKSAPNKNKDDRYNAPHFKVIDGKNNNIVHGAETKKISSLENFIKSDKTVSDNRNKDTLDKGVDRTSRKATRAAAGKSYSDKLTLSANLVNSVTADSKLPNGSPDLIKLSEDARRSSNYQNVLETIKKRKSSKERQEEEKDTAENSRQQTSGKKLDAKNDANYKSEGGRGETHRDTSSDCSKASTLHFSQSEYPPKCSKKPPPRSPFTSHLPNDPPPTPPPSEHLRREPASPVASEQSVSAGVRRSNGQSGDCDGSDNTKSANRIGDKSVTSDENALVGDKCSDFNSGVVGPTDRECSFSGHRQIPASSSSSLESDLTTLHIGYTHNQIIKPPPRSKHSSKTSKERKYVKELLFQSCSRNNVNNVQDNLTSKPTVKIPFPKIDKQTVQALAVAKNLKPATKPSRTDCRTSGTAAKPIRTDAINRLTETKSTGNENKEVRSVLKNPSAESLSSQFLSSKEYLNHNRMSSSSTSENSPSDSGDFNAPEELPTDQTLTRGAPEIPQTDLETLMLKNETNKITTDIPSSEIIDSSNVDEIYQLKEMEGKNDDNDEAFDDCDASSTSASDTDDDKHVSGGYSVTHSSSISDIENINDTVKEINCDENIKTDNIKCDKNSSDDKLENENKTDDNKTDESTNVDQTCGDNAEVDGTKKDDSAEITEGRGVSDAGSVSDSSPQGAENTVATGSDNREKSDESLATAFASEEKTEESLEENRADDESAAVMVEESDDVTTKPLVTSDTDHETDDHKLVDGLELPEVIGSDLDEDKDSSGENNTTGSMKEGKQNSTCTEEERVTTTNVSAVTSVTNNQCESDGVEESRAAPLDISDASHSSALDDKIGEVVSADSADVGIESDSLEIKSEVESCAIEKNSESQDRYVTSGNVALNHVRERTEPKETESKATTDQNAVQSKRSAKRSSSSDGLSSSSDIERSDGSDSADTIIENNQADVSVTQSITRQESPDVEGRLSDDSEEGNLVSIVSVGGENKPTPMTHGSIYIRSDSTDFDVPIKPTCIVVKGGSSSAESGEDCESDADKMSSRRKGTESVSDITITSNASQDHVMSVQVTSPNSSRSGSPAREGAIKRTDNSPEPVSGLANYFTLTLGFDSPHTPRRHIKTPEVKRRTRTPERTLDDRSKTLSPSPTLTPSPVITPTPEASETNSIPYSEKSVENEEGIRISDPDDREITSRGSYDDGHDYSSGGEEYDDHVDDYDNAYIDENMDDNDYFNDDEYVDDDDYDYEIPQGDIKSCKQPFDFKLHTIIEESCEESDYERKQKDDGSVQDPSELEKYFFFDLGNGMPEPKKIGNEDSEFSDSFSESSSSIFNDCPDLDSQGNEHIDPAELASSRLEKYFLTELNSGFERRPSIRSVGEESEAHTDESGSVGSDSEGSPSPEQPRKKLLRPRGLRTSRGYSSDRGEGSHPSDGSHHSGEDGDGERSHISGEDEISTESEDIAFDKMDGQFDTIKRRKKKKNVSELTDRKSDDKLDLKVLDLETKEDAKLTEKLKSAVDGDHSKYSIAGESKQKENLKSSNDLMDRKYQSRDSGFIGSSDDLLKDKPEDIIKNKETKDKSSSESSIEDADAFRINKLKNSYTNDGSIRNSNGNSEASNDKKEERSGNGKVSRSSTGSSIDFHPFTKDRVKVSRKDSFNWSSDEETNIMMNRMKAFFRGMLTKARENASTKEKTVSVKSSQMLLFEAKLTSLMKKVPDINDEQVKEIVEYLSSEDTWSDSYDSSDLTSELDFDLNLHPYPSELRQQISASCQEIIEKFDQSREPSDTDSAHSFFGGRAPSESSDDPNTMLMYQRLVSTIGGMKPDSDRISIGSGSQNASPPLLAKVFHHIGNSLVELMHEVSGASEAGDDLDSLSGRHIGGHQLFKHPDTSFESDGTPTDTENSPDSNSATPNISKKTPLSIINERSSLEDFNSLESQRTVFASHDSPRHYPRPDSYLAPTTSASQRSLEERGVTSIQYYVTEGNGNEPEVWQSVTIDEDKFDAREHINLPKSRRTNKRPDYRKAKSHMSLEKIHHEELKTPVAGERSESLGDLFDRFKNSEFSTTSSYEQLDSDSTLKASDSLDRHIGSSSSNIRLNASSRGSLTTSSRGSLAASSRGSLQGSSGPEDEEEKKNKKLSFFRYPRRSSMPDPQKNNDRINAEIRSTTLPRSNPAQLLPTATLPRTLPSTSGVYRNTPSFSYSSTASSTDSRGSSTPSGVPRSARYHAPGYRPPPSSKRSLLSSNARKGIRNWSAGDDGGGAEETSLPPSRGSYVTTPTHHHHPHPHPPQRATAPPTPSTGLTMSSAPNTPSHGGYKSTGGSPARQSPLNRSIISTASMGSGGTTGGNGNKNTPGVVGGSLSSSIGSSVVSGDVASSVGDEDVERLLMLQDRKRHSLTTLGSRSESMASVCSGSGVYNNVTVRGDLQLQLDYSYKESTLQCRVVQCRDLAPVEVKKNRSDPYVKVYLLPDKSKGGKRKTKVKKHTLNPTFDETLKFPVAMTSLSTRTLWLSVWHSDTFGRNEFLGEIYLPMADVALDDGTPKWYTLQEKSEPMEDMAQAPPTSSSPASVASSVSPRGDIIIAMKFVPPDPSGGSSNTSLTSVGLGGSRRGRRSKGGLYVLIKEAKNLYSFRPNGTADPICKGTLMPEKGRSCKQKTSVCRKTLNPQWDHTMFFDDVSLQDLMERSLVLSLWDHDRLGHSQFLGGCRLNLGRGTSFGRQVEWMDATGMERLIWEHMLERVNLWVESAITLRTYLDKPVYPRDMNCTERSI